MSFNWRMMIIKLCKNLWTSRVFVLAWLHFTQIPWARRMHQKNLTIQYGGLELELYHLPLESVWEINCRQNISRIIFVSSQKIWWPKIASKLNPSQAKETQHTVLYATFKLDPSSSILSKTFWLHKTGNTCGLNILLLESLLRSTLAYGIEGQ